MSAFEEVLEHRRADVPAPAIVPHDEIHAEPLSLNPPERGVCDDLIGLGDGPPLGALARIRGGPALDFRDAQRIRGAEQRGCFSPRRVVDLADVHGAHFRCTSIRNAIIARCGPDLRNPARRVRDRLDPRRRRNG
jgi:hypothetical protein